MRRWDREKVGDDEREAKALQRRRQKRKRRRAEVAV
jgi:hypothetical protein